MDKINLFISNFEIKDARRLFMRILLFIPVLLFVLIANIYIDPIGLYKKTGDEGRIAQALAEGRDVPVFHQVNYRLLRKYFIDKLTFAPDIVVLGSSHACWIGDNIFPNKKIINNVVTTATLADYLGIFEGYVKRKLFPQRVICLLDASLVCSPLPSDEWDSIKEDTFGMLDRLGIRSIKFRQSVIPQKWINTVSFSYFQESMQEFWKKHIEQVYLNKRQSGGPRILLHDGRWLWRRPSTHRKEALSELYYQTLIPLGYSMKPDKELEGILEKFIQYLMGHHVQVTLLLLPVHPDIYKSFIDRHKRQGDLDLVGVEHYYRGLAQRLNLEMVGSYDPAVCHLEENDFYNGDHISNDVLEKMLKQRGSPCTMPGL